MKTTIKVEKEVDIRRVRIDIAPRYIGDSDDDDVPTDFPLLNEAKDAWVADVDVDTGQIANWPAGEARELSAKVCDAGVYTLFDAEGNVVTTLSDYVPNELIPGEYGDYIELKINEQGVITNWPKKPSFSNFFPD